MVVLLLILALVLAKAELSDGLFWRACTNNDDRILLCINECEKDQITQLQSDSSPDVMYSTLQVVLDFTTETLDTPGDKDVGIECPLGTSVIQQPHNTLSVTCDATRNVLIWNLTFDNITHPLQIETVVEQKIDGDKWYDGFFFLGDDKQLYFVWEATNHEFRSGKHIDLSTDPPLVQEWHIDVGVSLAHFALVKIRYPEEGQCEVTIQEKNSKKYPAYVSSFGLVAFPETNYMWHRINTTGIYKFTPQGIVDSRRMQIVEVSGTHVTLHSLKPPYTKNVIKLEHELEKYQVRRPTVVQPSILIFSLSVCVVIVLVTAEIITQRRKAGKPCFCWAPGPTSPSGSDQGNSIDGPIRMGGDEDRDDMWVSGSEGLILSSDSEELEAGDFKLQAMGDSI